MLKICLQLLLLSLVLNVWNQNFLEPMCPVNGNSRCCFIWGDFLIFFSFICSVPFSGAPVVLTGNIAYHSSQLYSDCLIALSFSSIFSEVRLLQSFIYISTSIFRHMYSVLYFFYVWVFHHGMCSLRSLFLPLSFTAFIHAYQAYFGILPYLLY